MTKKENWYECPSRKRRRHYRSQWDKLIVHNDLHGTQHRFRTRFYRPLTEKQVALCRQSLCPDGRACQCGGVLKERGPQDVVIQVGFDIEGRQTVSFQPVRGRFL